jgi:hypothetical protein
VSRQEMGFFDVEKNALTEGYWGEVFGGGNDYPHRAATGSCTREPGASARSRRTGNNSRCAVAPGDRSSLKIRFPSKTLSDEGDPMLRILMAMVAALSILHGVE